MSISIIENETTKFIKLKRMYKPGLHLISEFKVVDPEVLKNSQAMKQVLDDLIQEHKLSKVGEVYHQFPDSGYTAMVCLTESHISIHTWPEFNQVTFDVFLSNFMNYNNDIVTNIHNRVLAFLNATDVRLTQLNR